MIFSVRMPRTESGSYHELHVASSRSLSAGRGNLLTKIRRWYDLLGKSHAVVCEVNALQSFADDRVVVDGSGDVVEQFNDQLGHVVAWSSLDVTADIHRIMNHRSLEDLIYRRLFI